MSRTFFSLPSSFLGVDVDAKNKLVERVSAKFAKHLLVITSLTSKISALEQKRDLSASHEKKSLTQQEIILQERLKAISASKLAVMQACLRVLDGEGTLAELQSLVAAERLKESNFTMRDGIVTDFVADLDSTTASIVAEVVCYLRTVAPPLPLQEDLDGVPEAREPYHTYGPLAPF